MSRVCNAEEDVVKYFEALTTSRALPEVGVLIGKPHVKGKHQLMAVVRTPQQEAANVITVTEHSTAAVKGKKPGTSVSVALDDDWVAEHCRQVARMLPGGLSVLGLYLYGVEGAFQAAVVQLARVLWEFAQDARAMKLQESQGEGVDDLLLIHADVASRKLSVKVFSSCEAAPPSSISSLKPCELRPSPVVNNLICMRCWFDVHCEVPVLAGLYQDQRQVVEEIVHREARRIRSSIMAVEDTLLDGEGPLLDALGPSPSISEPSEVTLYCPPSCWGTEGLKGKVGPAQPAEVLGRGTLSGRIRGIAYCHKREPLSRAVREIKDDLLRCLQTRVDLMVEDAMRQQEELQEQIQGQEDGTKERTPVEEGSDMSSPLLRALEARGTESQGPLCLVLPRRVLIPWLDQGLVVGDYLMEEEGSSDALMRVTDLLGCRGAKPTKVVEPEVLQKSPVAPWNPLSTGPSPASDSNKKEMTLMGLTGWWWSLISAMVLLLSVLVTFLQQK